ncbi:hypothetical protein ABVT39_021307 [Epinephelus coioides]
MAQLQVEDRAQQGMEERSHQGEDNTQEEEENGAQHEASAVPHPDGQCEEDCKMCKLRCDEINRLLEENKNVKHKLSFYSLLCYVTPLLPQGKRKLTPFQMLLITLMRLRLNLPLQHIGWGGRTSDKRVTENCGFPDKLLPGDMVLTDRGFDIRESVGMMCAEVRTQAFTKGQRQLDAKDVEETRSLANLRIHVERVIGVVRNKY